MRDTVRARTATKLFSIGLAMLALGGCAAASRIAEEADVPLQALGISRPSEPPVLPPPPPRTRKVRLAIETANDLNADDRGLGLATVARIYKLRDATAFNQATFETFVKPEQERAALAADLVEVREVILTPGQHFEAQEVLDNESPFLGVVALFREPAPYRWRFVFKASDAEKTGVLIGAHACALSVTVGLLGVDPAGRPLGQLPPHCH